MPNAATKIEIDQMDIKFQRWIKIVRFKYRLAKLDSSRLPVRVYKWESSLKITSWASDFSSILEYCNMSDCDELHLTCDLDVMKARLQRLKRNMWWVEACDKPKLHTFIQIHNKDHTNALVTRSMD